LKQKPPGARISHCHSLGKQSASFEKLGIKKTGKLVRIKENTQRADY